MQLSLPVPYRIDVKPARSRSVTTTPHWVCKTEEFEIPSFYPEDVNVVAEWQQQWDGGNRIKKLDKVPAGTWLEQMDTAQNMVRLLLADGKFFVPVRSLSRRTSVPDAVIQMPLATPDTFVGAIRNSSTHSPFIKSPLSEFSTRYRENLQRTSWRPGITDAETMPDMSGMIVSSDNFESMKGDISRSLDGLVEVAGFFWAEISEPVLILSRFKESPPSLSIGFFKEHSWTDVETYFALDQYDHALDYVSGHFTKKPVERVKGLTVFIPDALRTDLERLEAERGVRRFVTGAEILLPHVDAKVGAVWYQLRDALARHKSRKLGSAVDALMETVLLFTKSAEGFKYPSAEHSAILRFGRAMCDRWDLRPLERNAKAPKVK